MAHSKIWLNDVELREKIPSAIINRVIVSPVDIQPQYQNKLFSGRMLMNASRVSIGVTLQVQFRNSKDPVIRAEAVDALNAWAAPGGWLRLSNRPGKRLKVNAVKLASEETIHKYGEIAEIKFSADEVPYWESAEEKIFSFADMEGTVFLEVGGTAETYLDVDLSQGQWAGMPDFKIETGVAFVETENIDMTASVVSITHTPEGVLNLYENYSTLANIKRTADSSDALLIMPGRIAVTLTCYPAINVTFRFRERWV